MCGSIDDYMGTYEIMVCGTRSNRGDSRFTKWRPA